MDDAFDQCYKIKEFNMPDSVSIVGKRSLWPNGDFCEIKNNLYYCGAVVLGKAPEFDGHLVFDKNTKVIARQAFYRSGYNEKQEILDNTVTLPEGVIYIGEQAFRGNPEVENFILPDSVLVIEPEAFNNRIKIYGSDNSVGQEYAEKYQLSWRLLYIE